MKEKQEKEKVPEEIKEEEKTSAEESVTLSRKEWEVLSEQASKSAEIQDRLLRLAADFDNFRKRTDQEKRQLTTFVELALLSQFLPTLDSLEKILNPGESEEEAGEEHRAGLKLIAKEIYRTFQDLGLKPVEILGKPFDPRYAEVVEVTENTEQEEGAVLAVLRPGYLYKDAVLRPALVRISKKPVSAPELPEAEPAPANETTGDSRPGQD